MSFVVSYYFLRIFSDGLDETEKHETEASAIKAARAKVKSVGGSAHATIMDGARLVAVVSYNRGRVTTKRSK